MGLIGQSVIGLGQGKRSTSPRVFWGVSVTVKKVFLRRIRQIFSLSLFIGVALPAALLLIASPASASVGAFDCSSYDGPIFIEDDGNSNVGYNAKELNLSTGNYGSNIFTIKFSQNGRSWDYNQINSIAINPVDG